MAVTRSSPLHGREQHRDRILAELLRIQKKIGSLTPSAVVAAASDPKNILHGLFPWDDAQAAHQHRLDKARDLIRSFEVKFEYQEIVFNVQRFVKNPAIESHAQGYVQIDSFRSDKQLAREFVSGQLGIALTYVERGQIFATVLNQQQEFERLIAAINRLIIKPEK